MRFTINGQTYELTPEIIRLRLAGKVPDEIRQYWVEIDGVRWPVKQALRLAIGSSDFQSLTARSVLGRLGFQLSEVEARAATAAAPRRGSFDVGALEVTGIVAVEISFVWHRAGAIALDPSGYPRFPALPAAPGLYRFGFGGEASAEAIFYIGESDNLRRRASNYRNAKTDRSRQRTSRRLHVEIVDHLRADGSLSFDIATEVKIGGTVTDLRRKSARRVAENAAVLLAQTTPRVRVLNIDTELEEAENG